MKTMKKWIALLLAAMMLLSVLAGCGEAGPEAAPEENDTPKEKAPAVEPSGEPVEITWGAGMVTTEADMAAYEHAVQIYNETNDKNITVKLTTVEATDDAQYTTWVTSQLMGGVAPEVIQCWYTPAMENYKKGLVIDLMPYLNEKNPYSTSDETWWDTYTEGLVNQNIEPASGACPSIPLATIAVKIFYNKDIFEANGIDTIPETFPELMEVCQKLQDNGVVPFIAPNKSPADNFINWIHRSFMDQVIDDIIPDIDLNANGIVELNEICAATDRGQIDLTDERWSAPLPIMKEFSQYWYPGYNGIDNATAIDLFMKGEGAMLMNLGPVLKTFLENPDMTFEVGYFAFPYLTKDESSYAAEKLYEMGGAPQFNMCIPSSVTGDKLAAAVDFLQFLASDTGVKSFVEDVWRIPPFKEVSGLPEAMKDMYIKGSTSRLRLLAPPTDPLLYQDDTKFSQLFLDGQITAEEFSDALQQDLLTSVETIKANNGWSEENNWGAAQ